MAILNDLGSDIAKVAKAELIDTLTSQMAGIFSSAGQSIAGRLGDFSNKMPLMSYPIDLDSNVDEYTSKIQFTAVKYGSKKTSETTESGAKTFESNSPISEIKSVISLYHPHSLSIDYNNDWGTEELGVAGAIIDNNPDIASKIKSGGFGGKDISDFIAIAGGKLSKKGAQFAGEQTGLNIQGAVGKVLGVAENPRLAMLFKGVSPRTFGFVFNFAPRSEKEVIEVIAIMKAFRYYSAPGFSNFAEKQSFFAYPEVFNIKLFHEGEENTTLFPYGLAACTSVAYDLSPQAVWQTFANGFPVFSSMTLTFLELDIVTKQTIENEFK